MSYTDVSRIQIQNTEKKEEMNKLFQAISEIQNSDISLPKEATGQIQSRNYQYLTIGKLHEVVFPLLKEHGLVWFTQPTTTLTGEPALAYRLASISSPEYIEGVMPLCLAKVDPQGLGSALTYARRYALLCVLGLVGDDDDGAAGGAQKKSEAPQRSSSVPTIPIDRAKKILTAAQTAGLAEGTELKPALVAKLTEVGVETGRLGHLNVDQAETIEDFIAKEAA